MNNVLILGGSGLVGSNFPYGKKLSSKDVNLLNYEDTLKCFEKYKPDTIIHSASKKVSSQLLQIQKADYFHENMSINLNVFRAANKVGVNKLISLASINAFPYKTGDFFNEDDLFIGEPHITNYADAYNHRMKHILSKAYTDQYGMKSSTIFLSNTYGPSFKYICNGVVSIVIDKCHKAMKRGEDLVMKGDGSDVRDFIYVKDVVDLIQMLTDTKLTDSIIISSGTQSSIKEVVEIVTDKMNFKGEVLWEKWENKNLDNISKKYCDNSKLKTFFPKFEFTSLVDGISETIEWYFNNTEKFKEI
tara:strand:- start:445 stop:1353 length:909 start_codon:yes stop_codon:yes gene_type:complete